MHRAVSVSPEAPAREALRALLDNNVPGVPVVDARERFAGFVTGGLPAVAGLKDGEN